MNSKIIITYVFLVLNGALGLIAQKSIYFHKGDSNIYEMAMRYNQKNKLLDLKNNLDSIFLRIRVGTLMNVTNIFEIRGNGNHWESRKINIGTYQTYKYYSAFVLGKRYHETKSKKTVTLQLTRQISLEPIFVRGKNKTQENWKILANKLDSLHLFSFKAQDDVDTTRIKPDDGIWYDIEISDPKNYRYLFWANPKYASPSFEASAMIEIDSLLFNKFDVTGLQDENESFWTAFKANKWPKTRKKSPH